MPPRSDRCCDPVVVKAIKAAIPGFYHSCASRSSRHKAKPVPLTVINEYCTAVNETITTLSGDHDYTICYVMKRLFIKTSENNSADPGPRPEPPGRPDPPGGVGVNSDPPGVVGGIMLPGTAMGATVPKQEAAAVEIAVGNDRIRIHEYINRTNSIGLASSLSCTNNNTNNTSDITSTNTNNTSAASSSRTSMNNTSAASS